MKSKRPTGTSVSWTRRSWRFKEAVTEKDAHIGKLDDTLAEFKDAIGEKDAHIQKLDQHRCRGHSSLQEALAALAS